MCTSLKTTLDIIKYLCFLSIFIAINAQNINYQNTFMEKSTINAQFASKCLWNLTKEIYGSKRFISLLNCNVSEEPGYSIMSKVIMMLHNYNENSSFSYEVISNSQNNVSDNQNCRNENSKRINEMVYKSSRKTKIYIVFIDSLQDYNDALDKIEALPRYNIYAEFLFFYTNLSNETKQIAQEILKLAYARSKYSSMLLIPSEIDVFLLYLLNLYPKEAIYCGTQPISTLLSTCKKGVYNPIVPSFGNKNSGFNCTFRAVLVENPPYVISTNEGIEVRILQELEHRLNVTFEKKFLNGPAAWGYKQEDGNWSGPLNLLYKERFIIGIGAISTSIDRLQDFDATYSCLSENIRWLVPSSKRIDNEKLIFIVFTWTTWVALLIPFLVIGIGLWLVSNLKTDSPMVDKRLKTIGAAILVPVQITVSIAVWKQPRALTNRIIFISYALFIIIIGSLYQSALIKIMSKPPFKHQISTFDEIWESPLSIGGLPVYTEPFGNFQKSQMFLNKYINISENDEIACWRKRVASGDSATIVGEYYIMYYMGTPELTYQDGSSKVYLLRNDILYMDTYRITFSKNFILRKPINRIYEKLNAGGFTQAWTNYYINQYQHGNKQVDQEVPSDHQHDTIVLTMDHFKGAFFLLIFGKVLSTFTFILEFLIWKIKRFIQA